MLVILDQAYARRERQALSEGRDTRQELIDAVVEGALLRVRPKVMTVAAIIIGGLLPIMLGSGTGSELMRRIAAPMVGGMGRPRCLPWW
jgi:copper/silver efflux system protein